MNYHIAISEEDLAHESLDGEVVIVNLKNGRYYSLIDSASEIWSGIQAGQSSSQIGNDLRARFRDPEGLISGHLERFLQELVEEELIRLTPQEDSSEPAPSPPADAPEFLIPSLSKHVDMEGMLLLDPVHEVADQGWPEKKAGNF